MTESTWRKSSQSHQEGDCVEVNQDLRHVRDSKNPSEVLTVDVRSLLAHIRSV
ncbi:DUF397 domain-containing protein [Kibdelosporangium persicum]|uniref:DUF397 domain-containing protein n=1 Tax=Kibdelosporangium persicum TaxID=2698649 RepID=UPI001567035F|nr:DUF397 domain-containing protein [Kibdelosporangium persicum]